MSSGAVEKPAAFVVRIRKPSVIIQLSTALQGGAVQNTATLTFCGPNYYCEFQQSSLNKFSRKSVVFAVKKVSHWITETRGGGTQNIVKYISIVKPTSCTNVPNLFYFGMTLLHVSDSLSVHHQEFKTVQTATGVCQTVTAVSVCTVLNS